MMNNTDRRGFLRSSLMLAGGLLVGEEALEAFARLTHQRKSFPSAGLFKLPIPELPIYGFKLPFSVQVREPKWGGVIVYPTIVTHIEPEWLRHGA